MVCDGALASCGVCGCCVIGCALIGGVSLLWRLWGDWLKCKTACRNASRTRQRSRSGELPVLSSGYGAPRTGEGDLPDPDLPYVVSSSLVLRGGGAEAAAGAAERRGNMV